MKQVVRKSTIPLYAAAATWLLYALLFPLYRPLHYVLAAGAAAVTVHGRTREQMYAPGIDYKTIAAVKQAVKIPVIGNGDVSDGKSALYM